MLTPFPGTSFSAALGFSDWHRFDALIAGDYQPIPYKEKPQDLGFYENSTLRRPENANADDSRKAVQDE